RILEKSSIFTNSTSSFEEKSNSNNSDKSEEIISENNDKEKDRKCKIILKYSEHTSKRQREEISEDEQEYPEDEEYELEKDA
ncbi:171_t:CDS:2, partial [Scutellospora calospora]